MTLRRIPVLRDGATITHLFTVITLIRFLNNGRVTFVKVRWFRGDSMKRTAHIFVYLMVFIFAVSNLNVFATENAKADSNFSVELNDTTFNSVDEKNFNENVADDPNFINLVIQAAQKKEKDILTDGVHADRSIKLYGIKGTEHNLQSFYNGYLETGKIKNLISSDYALLTLYVNKDGEYVDSLVFTKKENLPESADKNGWVVLSSGSMATTDDIIVEYSKQENVKKYLRDLGLNNVKELKFVSGISNMPVSIYFVQNNMEFLIPLKDCSNMVASHVYRVSDICDKYLKQVLNYQNDKAEEYSKLDPKDRPVGDSSIPDNLPEIESIDLHTYFGSGDNEIQEDKNAVSGIVIIGVSVVVLLFVGYIIMYVIKRRKNNG